MGEGTSASLNQTPWKTRAPLFHRRIRCARAELAASVDRTSAKLLSAECAGPNLVITKHSQQLPTRQQALLQEMANLEARSVALPLRSPKVRAAVTMGQRMSRHQAIVAKIMSDTYVNIFNWVSVYLQHECSHMHRHLCICSTDLSICSSVCLCTYLIYLVNLSIFLSVCLCVCTSVYSCIYLSIFLFIYLPIAHTHIFISIYLSIYLYIYIYTYV